MLPRTGAWTWTWSRACSILRSQSHLRGIHAAETRRTLSTLCAWRSASQSDAPVRKLQYHQRSRSKYPYTTCTKNPYTVQTASRSSQNVQDITSTTPTPNNNGDNQETSEKLRKVLRKVPFPVVVVTTASPQDPNLRRGITVSSFTSISLQPIPLIAFCVKLPSRASTVLHESDRFVVQFLAADQIPHSVAFSSSVSPPPSHSTSSISALASASATSQQQGSRSGRSTRAPGDKDIEDLVSEASRQTLINNVSTAAASTESTVTLVSDGNKGSADPDPFEVLGYETDPESSLPVLLNTLGAVRCRTHQVMVVGDHEMWIGEVEKVLHGEIPSVGQEPLLYHDRSYRKVGRRIL